LNKKTALLDKKENNTLKLVARIAGIIIIVFVVLLTLLAVFLRHCEYNHRYFIVNTRIHAVRPNVYDAHYKPGTLVFVRPQPIREVEEGTIISMAVNADFPLTFNNERFVEFQEEFYGRSLHGIATENTVARDRIPLRGGRYIGVPYMGVPALGAILIWIVDNHILFSVIAVLLVASSVTAIILLRNNNKKEKAEKITFPKK